MVIKSHCPPIPTAKLQTIIETTKQNREKLPKSEKAGKQASPYVAERMGINGNSCYKTHYFLNTNLTITGEFVNSGKMDEHKSIE